MQSDEIEILLSVFGMIESIEIFGKNKKSGWKLKNQGFVTFTSDIHASRALINRKKFVKLFELSPADTWNQPDYIDKKKLQQSKIDVGKPQIELESKLMTTLNDDCLLHVMKFLDLLDVITLSEVCRKFRELFESHLKTIRTLNFSEIRKKKLTVHETKLVTESFGRNLVNVTISSEKFFNQRVMNFIPRYLSNLKQLHLTGFKLNSLSFWIRMSGMLSTLEILDLSDNSEVNESFLMSLKDRKSKLKVLSVANCNVNGKFLKYVPLIESLNISGCRHIRGALLLDFAEKNKTFKSLDISRCPNLDGNDVNEIFKRSPQLKTLSLNNYYIDDETSQVVIPNINVLINLKNLSIQNINYPPCDQLLRTIFIDNRIEALNISHGKLTLTSVYAISTMKHLRKLVMNFKSSIPEDLVDYLIKLKSLEEVHVSGCSYISPVNASRLLLLPRMKFIDVSRCYGFTNDFIIDAFDEMNKLLWNKRLTIRVGETEVDRSILALLDMKKKSNFIDLQWEATRDVEHDYDIDDENKYQISTTASHRQDNLDHEEYFTIDGMYLLICVSVDTTAEIISYEGCPESSHIETTNPIFFKLRT